MTLFVVSPRALEAPPPSKLSFHKMQWPEDMVEGPPGTYARRTVCGVAYAQAKLADDGFWRTEYTWPLVHHTVANFVARPCTRCFGLQS